MLVFITPKLDNKRIPYSYRARATIPSANIKDSRVTDDISSLKPDDIAVLGKKHTKEDAEYCISKERETGFDRMIKSIFNSLLC